MAEVPAELCDEWGDAVEDAVDALREAAASQHVSAKNARLLQAHADVVEPAMHMLRRVANQHRAGKGPKRDAG